MEGELLLLIVYTFHNMNTEKKLRDFLQLIKIRKKNLKEKKTTKQKNIEMKENKILPLVRMKE